MRRRLSHFAAAVSLVLCLLAITIAAASFWHSQFFWVYRSGNYISGRGTGEFGSYDDNMYLLEVSRGALAIGYENQRLPNPVLRALKTSHQGFRHASLPPRDIYDSVNYPRVDGLGFKYGLTVYKAGTFTFGRRVIVPFWFIILLLAMPPAALYARHVKSISGRRRAAGLCVDCGYDLTGNTSGVCPECGTAVAGKTEAKT